MEKEIIIDSTDLIEIEVEYDFLDSIFGKGFTDSPEFERLYWNYKIENDQVDAFPIEISSLIKLLKSIEEDGLKYVSIGFNVDHNSYLIQGHKIRKDEK